MSHVRPQPATLPARMICLAGLLGLTLITLADRGATRMYATPWNYLYWLCLLAPALLLLIRAGFASPAFQLPTRTWQGLVATTAVCLTGSAFASPYRVPGLQWAALPLAGLATFLLLHDWLQAAPANRSLLAHAAAITASILMVTSIGYWLRDVTTLTSPEFWSVTLFEIRNPHPLGHSNYTAGLALLSLPWLAWSGFHQWGWRRHLAWAASGLALLVLFTSGSRGGLLGLAALGIVALACTRPGWKKFLPLALVAVIGAGLLAVANPRIRALLGPPDPKAEPNISTVQRQAMLDAGLQMGIDRPLLGWGLHTTPLVYPRYRAGLTGGADSVLQLHSTPIELWAGLGLPGLLLLGTFGLMAARGWKRSPVAAATLAGYGVFALTDYQLDVPIFVLALATLAALLASPTSEQSGITGRLAAGLLGVLVILAVSAPGDRSPALNCQALALAADPTQHPQAIARLRESLALNPDQETAHFNLGWLLLVSDPARAEQHFLATVHLVPDKGGVYFGLGLARLNQGDQAGAAQALALECLNDPRFLASPWWQVPALAALRETTAIIFAQLTARAQETPLTQGWTENQAALLATLAPRLGVVSEGPLLTYRRERIGYPVLMRNLDLPIPVDLYDVREDPRFPASVPFPLPPKGWLPSPVLLNLLDVKPPLDQ